MCIKVFRQLYWAELLRAALVVGRNHQWLCLKTLTWFLIIFPVKIAYNPHIIPIVPCFLGKSMNGQGFDWLTDL